MVAGHAGPGTKADPNGQVQILNNVFYMSLEAEGDVNWTRRYELAFESVFLFPSIVVILHFTTSNLYSKTNHFAVVYCISVDSLFLVQYFK